MRLPGFDYTACGVYFVTICTHERQHLLGDVVDGKFVPAPCARDLEKIWARTVSGGKLPSPYDFVVMPNHVHGIVWLPRGPADNRWNIGASQCANPGVGTQRPPMTGCASGEEIRWMAERPSDDVDAASLQGGDDPDASARGCISRGLPEPGSLGAILQSFKSNAARDINRLRGAVGAPVWQGRYHDVIIRNERHLEKAQPYILNNPAKWSDDPMNDSP